MDIYGTPPTPEELAATSHLGEANAAPTQEELEATAPQAAATAPVSALNAAGKGLVHGVTLGFDDELLGGVGAAKDLLTGKTDLNHIVDAYKQRRDLIRQSQESAQSQHPYAYLGGELASAIPMGLATGGAGLAAEGAEGAAVAGNAGSRIAGAIGTGAGIGGLAAVGESNKEGLSSLEDAPKGALAGAVTGGLLQGAGETVKGLAGITKRSDIGQAVGGAFQQGREGTPLLVGQDIAAIGGKANATAEDVASSLQDQKALANDFLGKYFGASKGQNTIDVADDLAKLADQAGQGVSKNLPETQRAGEILSQMAEQAKAGLDPEKAQFYKRMLDGELQFQQGGPKIGSEAESLLNKARGLLSDNIRAGMPDNVENAYDTVGGISNLEGQAPNGNLQQKFNQVANAMNNLKDPENQRIVNDFFATVKGEMGDEFASDLQQKLQDSADQLKTAGISDRHAIGSVYQQLVGATKGAAVKGANVLGLGVGQAEQVAAPFTSAVKSATNMVANAAPQRLKDLGSDLLSSPAVEKSGKALGAALSQAGDSSDPAKRRALMFSIMQNPVYRNILGLDKKHPEEQ